MALAVVTTYVVGHAWTTSHMATVHLTAAEEPIIVPAAFGMALAVAIAWSVALLARIAAPRVDLLPTAIAWLLTARLHGAFDDHDGSLGCCCWVRWRWPTR